MTTQVKTATPLRNIRRWSILALFLLPTGLMAQPVPARKAEPDYALTVVADRPGAIYAENEPVTFKIRLMHHGKPVDGAKVDRLAASLGAGYGFFLYAGNVANERMIASKLRRHPSPRREI